MFISDDVELTCTTFPFIVSCGDPNKLATNLFIIDEEVILAKEKDSQETYKRQKPKQLYKELINLFSKDKSLHIFDICSGAGSCTLSCVELGRNCVVIEQSLVRARLIRQRVDVH